ncbi:hypothetical protein HUJ04_004311 [Dendroctonus ponderosae]|nr:hypothetical protein HUJ04_004311 [Dendroctonus ponderosae]
MTGLLQIITYGLVDSSLSPNRFLYASWSKQSSTVTHPKRQPVGYSWGNLKVVSEKRNEFPKLQKKRAAISSSSGCLAAAAIHKRPRGNEIFIQNIGVVTDQRHRAVFFPEIFAFCGLFVPHLNQKIHQLVVAVLKKIWAWKEDRIGEEPGESADRSTHLANALALLLL